MKEDDNDVLRALLRESSPRVPVDDVNWKALHAGITRRAQPLLQRSPVTWWHLVAGWSARGIPLGAAAAALFVLALGTGVIEARRNAADAADDEQVAAFRTLEEELATAAPLLVADADSDALIEAMLLYDGGEW